jgi:exosortase E/protease (VPEID-CTERM system)
MLAVVSYKHVVVLAWDVPGSRLGRLLQAATFDGVRRVLGLFYSSVIAVPSTLELGTARFQVTVSGTCSGIEGVGLMLALTVSWLIFTRRELRLQRAVLLVPVALAIIWVLNLGRIAALIAIGDAGYGDIAVHGFHSQAGWLIFNAVALGFLLTAQHLRWLQKDSYAAAQVAPAEHRNVAAIYLLPFLAVLAASIIGRAASSNFDWLYPLRLGVGAAVLWGLRAEYRKLDWRCGWLGPLAGAAVFAMWLALAHWRMGGADELGAQLARLAPWQRMGWVTARVLAAVVTVPVVEELAFRGYLARRVMSDDVDAVPFGRLSVLAIAVSSVAFGALHGNMWVAGTIAGVVFALVAKLRGRLGEAVAAHATANLMIAVWVLTRGDYRMW